MNKKNFIKVIYGCYKNSTLSISENCNIRPTINRVKVKVFELLKPYIKNSICLDLFGGTGSLSIESISLGAKKLIFIEKNFVIVKRFLYNMQKLDIENLLIYNMSAKYYLMHSKQKFHIIFLDPPYNLSIIDNIISIILDKKMLLPNGFIYLELNNLYTLRRKHKLLKLYDIRKINNTFILLLQHTLMKKESN